MPTLEWVVVDDRLVPRVQGQPNVEIAWAPQPGSQESFLTCPVFECLLEGPRGGGKTDALIADFCQDVGKGYGREWRGVLFRQTYPQLADVINKTLELIPQIFPDAKYNKVDHVWTFRDGEELLLRHAKVESDYWNYHGHNYTWLGWEELTTWADPAIYKKMFSTVRSKNKKIRMRVRSTTNPYGAGHNWVKHRFNLPARPNVVVNDVIVPQPDPDTGECEPPRVSIRSTLYENKVLLHSDPNYINRIVAAARNKAELAAWRDGSWDIVAGGMFDDIWDDEVHFLPTPDEIPKGWRLTRSFDWGSSRPFSVGWWAESDGSPLVFPDGSRMSTLRRDRFRVAEWYGWNGQPNEGLRMTAKEIARGIKEREAELFKGRVVHAGPADSSIFDVQDGQSVAKNMSAVGVRWTRAHKGTGSRKNGWERMREMLKGACPNKDGTPREDAGLFIFDCCDQFRRTVPVLPRDQKDLDDVDTDAEDHIGDECRYYLYKGGGRMSRTTRRH